MLDAYNKEIKALPKWYQQLQQEFEYEPGKVSSLGIIYWGKGDALHGLPQACTAIHRSGIHDISTLYDAIRTPAKMKKYAGANRIHEKLLRVLAHDIQLWLPPRTVLKNIPVVNDHPEDIQKLESFGLNDQITFLSKGQTKADRARLSKQLRMKEKAVTEYIRACDFFRMGGNADAIRPMLYYTMGYNTHEKWATATPPDIIRCFERYLKDNGLEGKYLVPFPKEVGNGIAWAKMHLRLFAVEY